MSVKNCGVFEERSDEFPVVSTSSTTDPLPEPVEGSSGDFSFVLSFGGSKRKNIGGGLINQSLSCNPADR